MGKSSKTIEKPSSKHGRKSTTLHKGLPEHKRILFEIQWYQARNEELRMDNRGIKEETMMLEKETTRLQKEMAMFEEQARRIKQDMRRMELVLLEQETRNLQLL